MPVFRPEDLSEAGAGASSLLQGLASTIANNVCSLYQNAPRGFVGTNPVSDAVNAFNSGFWDDFCGRLPEPKLPQPPSIPFQGGQCCDTAYKVDYSYSLENKSTQAIRGPFSSSVFLALGRIVSFAPTGDPTNLLSTVARCDGSTFEQNHGTLSTESERVTDFSITGVVPYDGALLNNCENPEASYPPNAVPPPQNPGTYPYVGNDGIERPVNFSIDFDPTINGPLVRLPDIPNLCVGFGFSGIEIDLCTNKPGSGTGGDISEIEDKIDALRDILDRLEEDSKENLNKEDTDDNPPDQTDPENEPPDGGISKCVPNLRFVKVTLTNIPSNANVEVGQAGFDRIDDAGWLTFTKDGFFFPPQRIEFGGAIFEAPPGVECFTMQLRFGFTAVVTTVVKDS